MEVNSLSSEDGALRWDSVLEGLVPLSVSSIQVEYNLLNRRASCPFALSIVWKVA